MSFMLLKQKHLNYVSAFFHKIKRHEKICRFFKLSQPYNNGYSNNTTDEFLAGVFEANSIAALAVVG